MSVNEGLSALATQLIDRNAERVTKTRTLTDFAIKNLVVDGGVTSVENVMRVENDPRPEAPMPVDRAGRLVLGVKASGLRGPSSWVAAQAASWPDPVLVVHAWTDAGPGLMEADVLDWFDVDVWPEAVSEPGLTAAAALRERGVRADVEIRCGGAAESLLSILGSADEVVLGSRPGRAWRRAFGANVVHCLLERSPCPVVVVPEDWEPATSGPIRIVVAYDGTAASDAALTWAIGHSKRVGGVLDLVRVVFSVAASLERVAEISDLSNHVALQAAEGDLEGVRLVELGREAQGIAGALARESVSAHALVLGSHVASWLSEVMDYGTVERTSSMASCPIVVVPTHGATKGPR